MCPPPCLLAGEAHPCPPTRSRGRGAAREVGVTEDRAAADAGPEATAARGGGVVAEQRGGELEQLGVG